MKKVVNIVCTRLLDENYKIQANLKGIHLDDHTFVRISYNNKNTFKQSILSNSSPFLFTSVHGIKACISIFDTINNQQNPISCYCINGATYKLALSLGFNILGIADNAINLGKIIIKNNEKQLLHCTTNIRRTDIYDLFKTAGILIESCEVYNKEPQIIELSPFDGIMFYAPSQIDAFLLKNKLDTSTPAFCIGHTTANHLVHLQHQNIIIAKTAKTSSILKKVYNYYK